MVVFLCPPRIVCQTAYDEACKHRSSNITPHLHASMSVLPHAKGPPVAIPLSGPFH